MRMMLAAGAAICIGQAGFVMAQEPDPIAPHGLNSADYSVDIVDSLRADETWHVTGLCEGQISKRARNHEVDIIHFYDGREVTEPDKKVHVLKEGYLTDYDSADRDVCIAWTGGMSRQMRAKLGLRF